MYHLQRSASKRNEVHVNKQRSQLFTQYNRCTLFKRIKHLTIRINETFKSFLLHFQRSNNKKHHEPQKCRLPFPQRNASVSKHSHSSSKFPSHPKRITTKWRHPAMASRPSRWNWLSTLPYNSWDTKLRLSTTLTHTLPTTRNLGTTRQPMRDTTVATSV